jgi:hypothetical protein
MFDSASKYCFSLDKNSEKNMRCFLLLLTLEKYINGAIIEMGRLNKIRQLIKKRLEDIIKNKKIKRGRNFQLTYLANDTHFYFVCIDKAYKLISKLGIELNDPGIKKLSKRLKNNFDIKTIRNHLEHIDARCLGFLNKEDEQNLTRRNISDFGNFVGEDFTFNGKKFPSGKESLLELKKIYIDLIDFLTKNYASKDPYFIHRQQQERTYKKIMQGFKKLNYEK